MSLPPAPALGLHRVTREPGRMEIAPDPGRLRSERGGALGLLALAAAMAGGSFLLAPPLSYGLLLQAGFALAFVPLLLRRARVGRVEVTTSGLRVASPRLFGGAETAVRRDELRAVVLARYEVRTRRATLTRWTVGLETSGEPVLVADGEDPAAVAGVVETLQELLGPLPVEGDVPAAWRAPTAAPAPRAPPARPPAAHPALEVEADGDGVVLRPRGRAWLRWAGRSSGGLLLALLAFGLFVPAWQLHALGALDDPDEKVFGVGLVLVGLAVLAGAVYVVASHGRDLVWGPRDHRVRRGELLVADGAKVHRGVPLASVRAVDVTDQNVVLRTIDGTFELEFRRLGPRELLAARAALEQALRAHGGWRGA